MEGSRRGKAKSKKKNKRYAFLDTELAHELSVKRIESINSLEVLRRENKALGDLLQELHKKVDALLVLQEPAGLVSASLRSKPVHSPVSSLAARLRR